MRRTPGIVGRMAPDWWRGGSGVVVKMAAGCGAEEDKQCELVSVAVHGCVVEIFTVLDLGEDRAVGKRGLAAEWDEQQDGHGGQHRTRRRSQCRRGVL